MKILKRISLVFIAIFVSLFLVSCFGNNENNNNNNNNNNSTNLIVTFKVDDTVIQQTSLKANEKINKPVDPVKKYHKFIGWYNGENEWDFENNTVTESLTLTAKFLDGYDSDGYKKIDTKEKLIEYASSSYNYADNARLYADIDLGGMEWEPIGTIEKPYMAIFDGNGYIIKDFKLNSYSEYNGLFGYVVDTEIKNLGIEEINMYASYSSSVYIGTLVGYVSDSEINNCYVKNDSNNTFKSVKSTSAFYIGGLIGKFSASGENGKALVKNCYADLSMYIEDDSNNVIIGGLIGEFYNYNKEDVLDSCYSVANIEIFKDNKIVYAGGLVGKMNNINFRSIYNNKNSVKNCYSTGKIDLSTKDVNGELKYIVGGFIGQMSNISMNYCYSSVNLNYVTNYKYNSNNINFLAGGLVGNSENSTIIKNSYATGNINFTKKNEIKNRYFYVGGLVGFNEYIDVVNSYYSGSVNIDIANIDDINSFCYITPLAKSNNGNIFNSFFSGNMDIKADIDIDIYEEFYGVNSFNYLIHNDSQIKINNESIDFKYEDIKFVDMEYIWNFVSNNWEDNAWNLYTYKNPTLKENINEEKETIIISSASDFTKLSGILLENKLIEFRNNINLNGLSIEPIHLINSTVDGNNNKIYNYKITNFNLYNGLFGYCYNSNITNLNAENVEIKYSEELKNNTYRSIGSLAGYASISNIINCSVSNVSIDIKNLTSCYIGTLAGFVDNIADCSASGIINVESLGCINLGGLAGYSKNIINSYSNVETKLKVNNSNLSYYGYFIGGLVGDSSNMSNCYSLGDIDVVIKYNTLDKNTTLKIGGLVGEIDMEVLEDVSVLNNSYSSVNITVDYQGIVNNNSVSVYAGSLIGVTGETNIKDCYATGNIVIDNYYYNYIGGLIGRVNVEKVNIENCYSTGNVTVTSNYKSYAGGFIGYYSSSYEVIIANSYATGNVSLNVSSSENAYAGGFIGYIDKSEKLSITNCYRNNAQTIVCKNSIGDGNIYSQGNSVSLNTIWQFVYNTWDKEIWNLFTDKNPTLNF